MLQIHTTIKICISTHTHNTHNRNYHWFQHQAQRISSNLMQSIDNFTGHFYTGIFSMWAVARAHLHALNMKQVYACVCVCVCSFCANSRALSFQLIKETSANCAKLIQLILWITHGVDMKMQQFVRQLDWVRSVLRTKTVYDENDDTFGLHICEKFACLVASLHPWTLANLRKIHLWSTTTNRRIHMYSKYTHRTVHTMYTLYYI